MPDNTDIPNSPSDGQIAPKPKHPGGRPAWKIDSKIVERTEALAARGLRMDQIALVLGIGLTTLYRKKKQFGKFRQAIERGKASGVMTMSNKLWDAGMRGNITAMIFWLKAQAGWRDTAIDINVSGEVGVKNIEAERERQLQLIRKMTVEERAAYIKIVRDAQARVAASAQPAIEVEAKKA